MFALTSLARASDGDVKEAKLKLVGGAVTAHVLYPKNEISWARKLTLEDSS